MITGASVAPIGQAVFFVPQPLQFETPVQSAYGGFGLLFARTLAASSGFREIPTLVVFCT